MRKKPVVPCGPANSHAGTVLGSGAITPIFYLPTSRPAAG